MRFLDFNLRPKKMTLKAQIFPNFFTSEGDRFPTFGGIFSDLRWKSKNRIGNAYSIVLRSRKIPHMTKSVRWFGCRLWCYRFKSLHILYFRLFCRSNREPIVSLEALNLPTALSPSYLYFRISNRSSTVSHNPTQLSVKSQFFIKFST